MPIGLTSDELFNVFVQSLLERGDKYSSEMEAMRHGESPEANQVFDELRKKFPTMDFQLVTAILVIVQAFMDTVVRNNDALSKVIPHVDS